MKNPKVYTDSTTDPKVVYIENETYVSYVDYKKVIDRLAEMVAVQAGN